MALSRSLIRRPTNSQALLKQSFRTNGNEMVLCCPGVPNCSITTPSTQKFPCRYKLVFPIEQNHNRVLQQLELVTERLISTLVPHIVLLVRHIANMFAG